ncbi:MAG TPA: electron transfer flavoprotein subunit alpha/FixB family protein [Bryobacteraceae bacterium]|nr:electron transfer flavoprotein subunit alpha/FixB family protein [Bryobacteraceae bacterium]
MSGVLVFLEQKSGVWNRMSWEALAAGQQLAASTGQPLAAAILGANAAALAAEAAKYKLDELLTVENPALANYTADGYSAAAEQVIRQKSPDYVLFPHTYQVRDFAPKVATRFHQLLVSDVIDIKQGPILVRQLFQGKLSADVQFQGAAPYFLSVQAGAFRADKLEAAASAAAPQAIDVQMDASKIRSQPGEPFRESQRAVDLTAANIIVSVGRGIKEKENIALVQDLATALGAELAASRPICDNGWLPMERQVGSSGQTVSPKVYIAIGISGAIQHLVGMKGAKTIVAINKDPNAPIFEVADYGIVGDLFEVVPALIEAVRKSK